MTAIKTDTLRVLTIGNGWFPEHAGGLNRYVRSITDAMSGTPEIDNKTIVLGPAGTASRTDVKVVSSRFHNILFRFYSVSKQILSESNKYDVVAVHFALYALILSLVKVKPPIVFHFHGPWAAEARAGGEGALVSRAKKFVELAVFRRVSNFIVLSNAFKEELVNSYGVDSNQVFVVAPGIDGQTFHPDGRRSAETSRIFLTVRRLVPRMGLDILIAAWSAAGLQEHELRIVGDGPEKGRLEELARSFLMPSKAGPVKFVGKISEADLAEAYRESRCTVIPTVALEGFGLVMLESFASGTPVIGSNIGGMGEFLQKTASDWVVEPSNIQSLSDALVRAAHPGALPSQAQCLGWSSEYSWERVVIEIGQIYRGVPDA